MVKNALKRPGREGEIAKKTGKADVNMGKKMRKVIPFGDLPLATKKLWERGSKRVCAGGTKKKGGEKRVCDCSEIAHHAIREGP